jgi:hypothetical protein
MGGRRRVRLPDRSSEGPDGSMYVTASRIQDLPWFNERWTRRGTKFGPVEVAAGESGTTTGTSPGRR